MDITIFETADGVKHYLYVIRDNFSRALLACKASLEYSSRMAKGVLHVVLGKHELLQREGQLITDGGSEKLRCRFGSSCKTRHALEEAGCAG